eukprot:329731-Pyramimonas_sp.AAC.1
MEGSGPPTVLCRFSRNPNHDGFYHRPSRHVWGCYPSAETAACARVRLARAAGEPAEAGVQASGA